MSDRPPTDQSSGESLLAVSAPDQPAGRLAVRPIDAGLVLKESTAEEFLPSVRPWVRALGLVMVGSFAGGIALMAVWPYRVVVRGQGLIRPAGETSVIHAPFSGRVRSINVRLNERVTRGQVIAVLNPADLVGKEAALDSSRAALEREKLALESQNEAALQGALLEVRKAEAALSLAETEARRYQLLASSGAVSAQQLDERLANAAVARSNLDQSRRAVEELRSRSEADLSRLVQQFAANSGDRAQIRRDLGSSTIRAPGDGVILSLSLRNPQQVVATGEELARIAPSGRALVAKVLISSQDVDNLATGQRADLRVDGCPYPDFGTLRAQVSAVSPDVVPVETGQGGGRSDPGAQSLVAAEAAGYEVSLQPRSTTLQTPTRRCVVRPGMTITADITTRQETVLQFLLRKGRFLLQP
jgi:multidrug efflux pump subunit AcrA (membrane-fusion protein)